MVTEISDIARERIDGHSQATEALSTFTGSGTLIGNQRILVGLIVAQLGTVDPALHYESPFTGVAPTSTSSQFEK